MSFTPYYFENNYPVYQRPMYAQQYAQNMTPVNFFQDTNQQQRQLQSQLQRNFQRPWQAQGVTAQEIGTIENDRDKFQVHVDVLHFSPAEISVKTSDGYVVIEGKHEEKKDEQGYVSRQFKRRYELPEGCNPESVESKLSADAVLTVSAPKMSESYDERAVPIIQTGPIRKKPVNVQRSGNLGKQAAVNLSTKKRRQ